MEELQGWTNNEGFSVKKARSNNYIKDFGASRVDISCLQDKIRPSEAHSRATKTIKRDCEFKAVATALQSNGRKWILQIKESVHTHPLAKRPEDVLHARRGFTAEEKEFVAEYNDKPGAKNRDIAMELRRKFPGIQFNRRQLRNLRFNLRKDDLDGHTAFQATMKILEDKDFEFSVQWSADDENKPTGLFWTIPWCDEMWKLYPLVQMYDNTYKTNNKGLAFFQVVSLNHLGKVFSCAFGLIDNERQEGFDWLMDQVNAHRERIGAGKPAITLTDFDKAMKNSVARVYPDADAQICIFHINKNVVLQVKRKWDKKAAAQVNAGYLARQAQQVAQAENDESEGDENADLDEDERYRQQAQQTGWQR